MGKKKSRSEAAFFWWQLLRVSGNGFCRATLRGVK
jgi:hypothetical protein